MGRPRHVSWRLTFWSRLACVVGCLAPLSLPHGPVRGEEAERPSPLEELLELEKAVIRVAAKAAPAVVFIGGGSGFCVSPEGLVLTNDHVVGNQKRLTVRFSITGRRHRATLLGRFPDGDIALLRIDEEGEFPHLELGDSDALVPGERVLALGNPFLLASDNSFFPAAPADYYPSTSLGVVSALHRNSPPRYPDAIQVDVAVNPGNSGGPLINMTGQVVGINGKIETRLHLSVNSGVGYAIPSRQLSRFLEPLRIANGGVIRHGRILGIEVAERVRPEEEGLLVTKVMTGTPADEAGFRKNDRILSMDTYVIPTRSRFEGLLQTYPIGSRITVRVLREDAVREIEATLEDLRSDRPVQLGIQLDPEAETRGSLEVGKVLPGSSAQRAGIAEGDVLLRFDNQEVDSFIDLVARIREKKVGDVVVVRVRRGDKDLDIPVLLRGAAEDT